MSRQAAQSYDSGAVAFFVETLCEEADLILRLAYALCSNESTAASLVELTYQRALDDLASLSREDSLRIKLVLACHCMDAFGSLSEMPIPKPIDASSFMEGLELKQRASLVLVDGLGFTITETSEILKVEIHEIRERLSEARQAMLKDTSSDDLSSLQPFLAHLSEYIDDELDPDKRKQMESALGDERVYQLATDYGIRRGQFQIALQKLYLNDTQVHKLHTLVEGDAERVQHEEHDIEDYSRLEGTSRGLRGLFLLILLGALVGGGYWYFAPPKKAQFSPLDTLVYESLVMIEEPVDRLDFPTSSLDELNNYFKRYPSLGFSVGRVSSPGADWNLIGASVIDYEIARIAVTQFQRNSSGEDLFLFLFTGQLNDLPYAQAGNQDGLLYRAFSSDSLNIVAWQASKDVVGMVVGYGGAEDLAAISKKSIGTY